MNGTSYGVPHSEAFATPITIWPSIHLRILFSNTLSAHSYLNGRGHVPQPYRKIGTIIIFHTLIFKLLERSQEDRSVWT